MALIIQDKTGRRLSNLLISLLLLVCSVVSCSALEVPELKGRVNDYAGLLSQASVKQLEGSLQAFEQEQSTQLVVVTIPGLENDSLEEFSIRLAEKWKIGHEGLDNGAILLVVRNERKIRIEVGYGLEGSLTDLTSGRIIRNIIVPSFKNGDFNQGIMAGISAMMDAVRGEFSASNVSITSDQDSNTEGLLFMLMLILLFIGKAFGRNKKLAGIVGGLTASGLGLLILGPKWLVILLLFPVGVVGVLVASAFAASKSFPGHSSGTGRYWGSGSSGGFGGSGSGGGFGGGGGGFGGGGASGGW